MSGQGIRCLSRLNSARRQASTSSYSVDSCPFRIFAKKHPEVAKLVLQPPLFDGVSSSVPFDHSGVCYRGESLESYMKWRGWDSNINSIFEEHNLEADLVGPAIGLVSHPLTFPLTLGRHATHFVQQSNKVIGKNERKRNPARICCIGARSECTLPDEYWKEFLVMTSSYMNSLKYDNQRDQRELFNQTFEWVIDFVGPDVPKQMSSKTISLYSDQDKKPGRLQHSLTMNYHTSFLHQLVLSLLKQLHIEDGNGDLKSKVDRLQRIQQHWDGFFLFNPGLGHPNLAKDWESTIKFVLKTNRPVLLTAHSTMDASRDWSVLQNRSEIQTSSSGIDIGYQLNPYASRMEFIDPFPTDKQLIHVVRPNHSVLLLNGIS